MKRWQSILLVMLFASFVTLGAAAGTLTIHVLDGAGQPMVGAQVSSNLMQGSYHTTMNGATFYLAPDAEHEITVEWAHLKQTKKVTVSGNTEATFAFDIKPELYLTFDTPSDLEKLNLVTGVDYYVNQWAAGRYDSTGVGVANGAVSNTSEWTSYIATTKAYGDVVITFSTVADAEPPSTQGMRVFFRESGLVDENLVFTGWGLNHSTYALDFALWAPHPTDVDPVNPEIKARMASRVGMAPPRQNDRDLRVVPFQPNDFVVILMGDTLTIYLNGVHVTTFPWDSSLGALSAQGRVVFSLPAWEHLKIQNIAVYPL